MAREAVFAELDRALVGGGVDRWVVLTGGPGMGKTAILASWLARRQAARDLVAHHFVQRQQHDRVEPTMVARSLAARIEAAFPAVRDPYARPEARLSELLARVSDRELSPRATTMVLLLDGLDERHPVSEIREVLAYFPRALPRGFRLLCAGRHRDPASHGFEDRVGQLVRLDLDDPSLADDNDATVRALVQREAPALGLDDWFVEHAVRCAGGNALHASLLCKHLASIPHSQRGFDGVPRGLPALLDMVWQRVAGDPAAVRALGILCTARGPLSLEQVTCVAGWSDVAEARAAMRVARALVIEVRGAARASLYRPFHEVIRAHVVEQLGAVAIRDLHHHHADKLATWPARGGADARRYTLQHAVGHRIASGDCKSVHALASNVDFLEAKCVEHGVDDVELEVRRAARACLGTGHVSLAGELDALARTIASESRPLRHEVHPRTAQVWDGLRRTMRRTTEVEPRGPRQGAGAAPGAGRGGASRARPVPWRDLPAHAVTACAVTPDGRRVVSAASDHSLTVWDLDSGGLLGTLSGHTAGVASCAVTLDGRRLVSASADHTLKVWDLDACRLVLTLAGHSAGVESCAIIPHGRHVVSASADQTLKVWDIETGSVVTTFHDHRDAVTHCAATSDGRRVISVSADTTIKVWDLYSGDVITTLEGDGAPIASLAVTSDGQHVVSGASDHTLKVWSVETGRMVASLEGHTGWVTSCVVAPDDRVLYSGSYDTTLKIWDLETGCEISTLEGHAGPVTCCALSRDGSRLITGSSTGALKVWDLGASHAPTVRIPSWSARPVATPPVVLSSPRVRKGSRAGQHIILFLAANPVGTSRVDLDKECAAIERELQMAPHGGDFEFRSKWAVDVDEMARHLIELDPVIVHFSGHGRGHDTGASSSPSRDVDRPGDSGIYLHDEQHGIQIVPGHAVAKLVETTAPSARVVMLNACYSDGHAKALCEVVDCVVGMSRAIHDHAARSFAVAFYRALGNRRSIGAAFDHAVAVLAAKHLADETVPRCRSRHGVVAQDIVLEASASEYVRT